MGKKYYNIKRIWDILFSTSGDHHLTGRRQEMKKLLKWFLGFAAIGTAVGLAVAYFCKNSAVEYGEDDSDTEDKDFDLDVDLKPASERGYVSLQKSAAEQTDKNEPADTKDEETPASTEGEGAPAEE